MSDTLTLGTFARDDTEAFRVPLDVARYSQALLAVTGLGKSNAAVVLGEEFYAAGIPWVAIDPKGDWYGIRYSGVDGEPGLPIPVFGGLYGNSPLRPEMGARMAELVVEKNMTCVLDVSDFETKNDMLRFVNDFVKTLFRLHGRHRSVRHVFLEECDEYMPQKVVGSEQEGKNLAVWTLAICQKLVKQGRGRGLGCTMISQRPAVVNKDALTQIQTMYVLGMTSPQDRSAIKAWVDYHVGAKEIVDSLPMLEPGEAWVLSPRVLKLIERINFRRRWTLDTGSTPEFGATAATIGTMATIDMAEIEAALADVIEKAKEDDPAELRKELAATRGRLDWWGQWYGKLSPDSTLEEGERLAGWQYTVLRHPPGQKPETGIREVPVEVLVETKIETQYPYIPPQLLESWDGLVDAQAAILRAADQFGEIVAHLGPTLETLPDPQTTVTQSQATAAAAPAKVDLKPAARAPAPVSKPARHLQVAPAPQGDIVALKAGARRMLEALARQYPIRLTRRQLGTLARVKASGGTFGDYLSVLRKNGYVLCEGDWVDITESGFEVSGVEAATPMTTDEIVAMYKQRLKAGARRMLDVLVEAWPNGLSRDELGSLAEVATSGGTFGDYLSVLRSNGLAEERDHVVYAGPALQLR